MRINKITLKNGLEVFIDLDAKDKCPDCKEEVVGAHVLLELVSLALWDVHKCGGRNDKEKMP